MKNDVTVVAAANHGGAATQPVSEAKGPGALPPPSRLDYPHKNYPKGAVAIEVAKGILWVSTPLPFRLRSINSYLIEEPEGWTIVDCGYDGEEMHKLWQAIWHANLKGKPITRVIVTHFHPDHVGNAAWFERVWGVRPTMTETEWTYAQLATRSLSTAAIEPRAVYYAKNGLPAELVQKFRVEVNPYPEGCPSVPETFIGLRHGQSLTINGHKWLAMIGRGHSPEHLSLYCDELGIMLAGDQILPEISPNVTVFYTEPDANALADFLATMRAFAPILREDTLVLPAHRRPFRGVHARFAELERHHELRLGQIMKSVGPDGITAGALLPLLFPEDLDGHQIGFGMQEALAHLNYLMYEGQLVRRTDAGGTVRFHKA